MSTISKKLTRYLTEVVYIRFDEQMITVRAVRAHREFSCPAVVGLTENGIPILGDEVQTSVQNGIKAQVISCFDHPRLIFADSSAVISLVKYCLDHLFPRFVPGPRLSFIFHPQRQGFGLLTPVELDAFDQIGRFLHASHTQVWMGANLADDELLGTLPEVKGRLYDTKVNYTARKLMKDPG